MLYPTRPLLQESKAVRFLSALLLGFTMASALCISSVQAMETITGIEYASVPGRSLQLDVYLPDNRNDPMLIVWVHGGAWRAGSRANPPNLAMVEEGFAVASVDFRNSPEAAFPAQMHDIKAAVRFLRANAGKYGYDASKIAIWGHSSGGHLAALAGLSNGHPELEGTLGNHLDVSSDIQAILDYAGPTNFETILHQSTPHGVNVRAPALELLLRKPVDDPSVKDLARLASPVFHVDETSPPLMLIHGVQDNQVPINQALELEAAYREKSRPVRSTWLVNAPHGSPEYFDAERIRQAVEFLRSLP